MSEKCTNGGSAEVQTPAWFQRVDALVRRVFPVPPVNPEARAISTNEWPRTRDRVSELTKWF